jgi:hypothetical protein
MAAKSYFPQRTRALGAAAPMDAPPPTNTDYRLNPDNPYFPVILDEGMIWDGAKPLVLEWQPYLESQANLKLAQGIFKEKNPVFALFDKK